MLECPEQRLSQYESEQILSASAGAGKVDSSILESAVPGRRGREIVGP